MTAGWHPDPTGRFGARFFDGSDWTDQVQGADGRETTDALERRSSGLAAPGAGGATPGAEGASSGGAASPAPPPPPPHAAPAWGGAAPGPGYPPSPGHPSGPGYAPAAPAPLAKGSGVVGVLLAGLGWLLAAASVLVLNWGNDVSRGDIADALPDPLPDGLELADRISLAYVQWAGLALLFLVLLGLGAVLLGLVGRDPTALRLAVGALAALAVVLHAFSVVRALRDSVEVGAHVGTLGYLVVLAGLAIGSRTRRTT